MTMNPLPPQAYTKDTLLKAYLWLQAQPSHIREMAMTPDILVSLYLKASRDGESALERPSIQNFKTELKNLAGLMGELDRPANEPAPAKADSVATPPPAPKAEPPSPMPAARHEAPPPMAPKAERPANPMRAEPSFHASHADPFHESFPPKSAFAAPEPRREGLPLDAKSLEMLKEIKEDYNLTSESEALRMLIKIGYTKAKSFLQKD